MKEHDVTVVMAAENSTLPSQDVIIFQIIKYMSAVLVRIGLKNNGSVGFFFFRTNFATALGHHLMFKVKSWCHNPVYK